MASNADYFLKKTLGEDFESLLKSDIYKPGSRTVVDINDIKIGLQIVPRVIMSFLIRELVPMEIGEAKEINVPVSKGATLLKVIKHERDSLSGEIIQENKKIAEFMHRSIPGIGLVLMSALELYEVEDLKEDKAPDQNIADKVNAMIEDRLALHSLIGKVVDKKILERDGVHQMFLKKLSELVKLSRETAPMEDPYFRGMANGIEVVNAVANNKEGEFVEAPKKGSPLKDFLGKREQKNKKNEFAIEMVKGETVTCPDCGNALISDTAFTGCVCLGDDMEKKVFIAKTEQGIKIRFGRGWDSENMEMLLEVLRRKRGRE